MATLLDLPKLSSEFERIAHKSEEDNILRLTSPGIEGFQIFLESVSVENTIGVQQIKSCFEEKKWSEARSLSWEDVESIVEFLYGDSKQVEETKDVDETMDIDASEFAELCEKIYQRQQSKEFPLVRPTDLKSEEDQEAASMSLSLMTKIEHVKIESYIAEERRKSLEAEFARSSDQWS